MLPYKGSYKRGAVHYEYLSAVFNWRKVFAKELIKAAVLFVVFMLLVIFSSKIASHQNVYYLQLSRLFFHFRSMDLFLYDWIIDINICLWKEFLNRIFIFVYSCQAFSTLKLNERNNNLFLSVLVSGNLLLI